MVQNRVDISESELEVLRTLWDAGPSTVRDVEGHLVPRKRRWAYTTIQTLLNRLEAKGYVKSVKTGLVRVFEPTVSRDNLLGQRLEDLAQELCGGAATPLVKALVRDHCFSADEIAEFRALIRELNKNQKKT